jgi:hypothetical protein
LCFVKEENFFWLKMAYLLLSIIGLLQKKIFEWDDPWCNSKLIKFFINHQIICLMILFALITHLNQQL